MCRAYAIDLPNTFSRCVGKYRLLHYSIQSLCPAFLPSQDRGHTAPYLGGLFAESNAQAKRHLSLAACQAPTQGTKARRTFVEGATYVCWLIPSFWGTAKDYLTRLGARDDKPSRLMWSARPTQPHPDFRPTRPKN